MLERFFNWLAAGYEISLAILLRRRFLTLLGSFAIILLTIWLAAIMPMGFLPSEDDGFLVASTEGEQGLSFQGMEDAQHQLDAILDSDPDIEIYNSVIGIVGSSQSINNGNLLMRLKSADERPKIGQVAQRLRKDLNVSPAMRVFVRIPPAINIGGRSSRALYQ